MLQIIHGDCREVLRTLPDESVHCCVTSPPYWGLRDYGLEPVVWGGLPECEHEWGEWRESHDEREAAQHGKSRTTDRFYGDESRRFNGNHQKHTAGTFCRHCNAWRGCLGLEPTPQLYVEHMVEVFREVLRVLRADGTCWLNIGDSYATQGGNGTHGQSGQRADRRFTAETGRWKGTPADLKPKDLCMMPARVAIALQAYGWWLRSENIWYKRNTMPESVKDRPTRAHEQIYLLTKSERYFYNADAVKEPASPDTHARYARGRSDDHKWADGGPGNQTIAKSFEHMRKNGVHPKAAAPGSGIRANESFSAAVKDVVGERNMRSVWDIPTQPYPEAHFATFPEEIAKRCILAGCPEGGTVLDPFAGSGTVGAVAEQIGCRAVLIEAQAEYIPLIERRCGQQALDFK